MLHSRSGVAFLWLILLHLLLAPSGVTVAKERPTYGFYLHVYREQAAVVNQLRSIQKYYPGAPVYMMSDGGLNFTQACQKLGGERCHFTWRPPAHDNWNPKPFLERFRQAAEWLNTEYVVMLEPDVTLHRPATKKPTYDAAGLADKWNDELKPKLRELLTELGKNASGRSDYELAWKHFGLAGGTAVRTEAALAAFKPDDIDWKRMNDLDDKRVYSSDVSMAIAMAAHGYTYGPWEELTTGIHGQSAKDKDGKLIQNVTFQGGAFQHHGADEKEGKPFYGASLNKNDLFLVEGPPPGNRDIFCQHCVWVSDKDCGKTSCPISQPNMGVSFLELPFVKEPPMQVVKGDLLANKGESKKLVVTTLIQDPDAFWGADFGIGGVYPEWVERFMKINVAHAGRHNHSHVVRTHMRPREVELGRQVLLSDSSFSKFSASWEKYRMLLDYLHTGEFSHVLFLDSDAIFARHDHDTVDELAEVMDRRGASILFADEDWRGPEHAQIHGVSPGLVMVRSTPEAKMLLQRIIAAGSKPQTAAPKKSLLRADAGGAISADVCQSDARLCLRAVLGNHGGAMHLQGTQSSGALVQMVDEAQSHIAVLSGSQYNRPAAKAGAHSSTVEVDADGRTVAGGAMNSNVDIVHFYMEQVADKNMLKTGTMEAVLEKARG